MVKGPVDAGERDRQVTLQQLTESLDASRFPVETWTTLAAVFARKVDLTGRERFVADQLSAPYDTTWNITYRTDMDPEVIDVSKQRRLVYQGRSYDIVNAQMVGRYESIDLLTLARQG